MHDSLRDKTMLITGANSGIGKIAALALARQGATLVMVARNRDRGEAALAEVKSQSDNSKVELLVADLSSQQQVRRLAAEFRAKHQRLDVLINNAGAIIGERRLTEDGIEETFAANHLGPFLLTNLLLDLVKQSAPARIVNIASEASRAGDLPFDDPNMERGYTQMRAYGRSKLANILFTRELARRLAGTGVTTVAIHPGVVRTRFGESGSGWFRAAVKLASPFLISPEKGADTMLWAATSPEAAALNGVYLIRRKVRTPVALARDDAAATRLWAMSAELTKLAAA